MHSMGNAGAVGDACDEGISGMAKEKPSSASAGIPIPPPSSSLGWFPEHGWLDRIDKRLSLWVFKIPTTFLVESVLILPGCAFGLPTSALLIPPLLITWFKEHRVMDTAIKDDSSWIHEFSPRFGKEVLLPVFQTLGIHSKPSAEYMCYVVFPATLAFSVYFYRHLYKGDIEHSYRQTRFLMFPALGLFYIAGKYLAPEGYTAGCFYVVSWIAAQAISHVIKVTAGRSRPLIHLSNELKDVKREIPEVQTMLHLGQSAFESFPSGDTVGAAVFSGALYSLGCPFIPAASFGVLTGFCRMLYHAHHFLDVSAGFLIGFGTTVGLANHLGNEVFGGKAVIGSLVLFMLMHRMSVRFKPLLPPEFQVKGRIGF